MSTTTQSVKFTGIAGKQTYNHGLDFTPTGVTVNGSAATFSDAQGTVTISSPTIAGGEAVVITGSENPQSQLVKNKVIDTANNNVIDLAGVDITAGLTPYTSTLSASSGSFTNATVTSAGYKQIGKLLFLSLKISITTNGTAAGTVNATLPTGLTSSSSLVYVLTGREHAATGKMLQGIIVTSSNLVQIFNYDNTYPGGDGRAIFISGWVEVA